MREKLIELISAARFDVERICDERLDCEDCPAAVHEGECKAGYIADHLIANGVTIAKWIPVTERLPEDSIPSTFYLGYWNGYIRVVKYWRTRKVFELRGKTVKVTHWMPLPSTEGLK